MRKTKTVKTEIIDGKIFRNDVQCFVQTLAYDFKTRRGTLFLEQGSCTDMEGSIALFKRIDRDVVNIQTLAGDGADKRRDTEYRLIDGGWQAFSRRHE